VTFVVREDSQRLFGFATRDERSFFLELQTVAGVGPAVAFRAAVSSGDSAQLRRVRGVGKRLSERLVVELRDKLGRGLAASVGDDAATRDACMALEQLGFSRDDAAGALRDVKRGQPAVADAGELVRLALKRL
jgi:Holliday junction DNA helicase RuvA